jgi:hypothetical protein
MTYDDLQNTIATGAAAARLSGLVFSLVSTTHLMTGELIGFTADLRPNYTAFRSVPNTLYERRIHCKSLEDVLTEMHRYIKDMEKAKVDILIL